MRFRLTLILCCTCLPASMPGTAAAQIAGRAPAAAAGGSIAAPAPGILLLKNGETLEGIVSPAGDYYLVVAENTELQVRARDVEFACRTLDEVVAHKGAKLNPRSADDHLALAQWCIDRELYGIAARELTAAWQIDDTHPRIVLLERRMKAAMSAPRALPPPPKPAAPTVDGATVNHALAGLSGESVHDFTVRVQPLLMNYCATAGCHGPKPKSEFQLERVYLNELNDSRLVRRNLYAVLKQVDRKNPPTSKLLTVPLSPHGGTKTSLFHAHNTEHYRQLATWVGKVAASATAAAAPPTTASTTATTDPLLQRLPIAPPGAPPPTAAMTAPSAPSSPAVAPVATTTSTAAAAAPLPAAGATRGSMPVQPPPADPFDPEIFNRRRNEARP